MKVNWNKESLKACLLDVLDKEHILRRLRSLQQTYVFIRPADIHGRLWTQHARLRIPSTILVIFIEVVSLAWWSFIFRVSSYLTRLLHLSASQGPVWARAQTPWTCPQG